MPPADFFQGLSPDARQILKIIAIIAAVLWLYPKTYRLWRQLSYAGRALYWKLKKFVKWSLELLTPHSPYARDHSYGMNRKMTRHDLETLYQSVSRGAYKPWRFDYIVACFLWAWGLGIIGGAMYWYSQARNPYILSLAMLSVPFLYLGFSNQESGQRRKHGKAVEDKARKSLIENLPSSWDVLERKLYDFGDIDILLRLANNTLCSVEIKSWHRWSKFWRTTGAIRQAYRQKLSVGASSAVIWLPCASQASVKTIWRILIVCGNEKLLVEEIGKRIVYDLAVRFPQKPPEYMRKWLRSMRFEYYPQPAQEWIGRRQEKDIKILQERVAVHKGIVSIKD
ncbi:MAG: hypothetical protein P4M15_02045 [Alphaproteobacteria bacterium]|nr:hypothetical protein [Alphaproteobacteria bacterium]